jgi:hypothetical protein
MKNAAGTKKYSRTIQLSTDAINFSLGNIMNPFGNKLYFDIITSGNSTVEVSLLDLFGKKVKTKMQNTFAGVNSINIPNTESLPKRIYILQVRNKEVILNEKVLKQ